VPDGRGPLARRVDDPQLLLAALAAEGEVLLEELARASSKKSR
jgi:hypothetical protein